MGDTLDVTLFSFGGVELLGGELTYFPSFWHKGVCPFSCLLLVAGDGRFHSDGVVCWAKGEEILCSSGALTHQHQHHSNSPKVLEQRWNEWRKWRQNSEMYMSSCTMNSSKHIHFTHQVRMFFYPWSSQNCHAQKPWTLSPTPLIILLVKTCCSRRWSGGFLLEKENISSIQSWESVK